MAYDDAQYLEAMEELDAAVGKLLENDISPADIHAAVDTAVENNS